MDKGCITDVKESVTLKLYTVFSKTPPFVLQCVLNTPELILMKITTVVALKLRVRHIRHLVIIAKM